MDSIPAQSRNTKQKKVILSILKGTTSHPGAEWIYDQVRLEIPSISLGTVYRNLKQLKESGSILEFNLSEGVNRFDGNTAPHYHFICDRCGHIFDVDMKLSDAIAECVNQKTGFKVNYHRLELHGLCDVCQRPITNKSS